MKNKTKRILSLLMAALLMFTLVSFEKTNSYADSGVFGSIAASAGTFYVKTDGTVWATGSNPYGQLGLGTGGMERTLIKIPKLDNVKQVASGPYHTIFLMKDGTVKASGYGNEGQLGIGSIINQLSLVTIPGLSSVKQIAVGSHHTVFLMEDGTVKVSGYNASGQLGIGNTANRGTAITIPGLSGVKQVNASNNYTVFLMNDGTVKVAGNNVNGQLGIGNTTNQLVPVIVPGLNNVTQISAGWSNALFLMGDGTVKATGAPYGTVPTVISGIAGVKQISAGDSHFLFLMSDGTVRANGSNVDGQLGDGTYIDKNNPVTVLGVSNAKLVECGKAHSVFLLGDGTIKVTGRNIEGQFGDGQSTTVATPKTISITGVAMPAITDGEALILATGAVEMAETTKTQVNIDSAMTLVTALKVSAEKTDLITRLDSVQTFINEATLKAQAIAEATAAVIKAEGSNSQSDLDSANALITALPNGPEKDTLTVRATSVQYEISVIAANAQAVLGATNLVASAETLKTQIAKSSAFAAVNNLPESADKTSLLARISAIIITPTTPEAPAYVSLEAKVADTKINLALSLPREPYLSLALVAIDKVSDPVEKAALVIEMEAVIAKSTAVTPISVKTINAFVRLAEITGRDKYIILAETKAAQIVGESEKLDAISRVDLVKAVKTPAEQKAYNLFIAAEQWKSPNMITAATKAVNALIDSPLKTTMLDRLSEINK